MSVDRDSGRFLPGVRVAMRSAYRDDWSVVTEHHVDKVYANGNFTLRGDENRTQWRNSSLTTARPAGQRGHWSHRQPEIHIWDKDFDAKRAESVRREQHRRRAAALETRMSKIRLAQRTPEELDKMDELLTELEKLDG